MHFKIMWTLQYFTTYFDVSYLFGQTLCLIQFVTCINKILIFGFFSGNIKVVHPVHLHGHHFHVIKIAYPPFDPETGNSTAFNPDIRCLNEPCSRATWADPSWINGNIPGVNLVNPPLKDTVNVPANGYVIIRFMADNPGIQIYIIFLVNSRLFFFNWYSFIGICVYLKKTHTGRSMRCSCLYSMGAVKVAHFFEIDENCVWKSLFHKFNAKKWHTFWNLML